jgi:hypothetical protein
VFTASLTDLLVDITSMEMLLAGVNQETDHLAEAV